MPEQRFGNIARGLGDQLDRGELLRFVVERVTRQRVANGHLDRRRDRGDRERDDEAEAVIAIAPTAQHAHRVDGCDEESADEIRGHHHVHRFVAAWRC